MTKNAQGFSLDPVTFEVLKNAYVNIVDQMAEQMVNSVYPMWSQVVDHDEFDKMVQPETVEQKRASAN